MTDMSLQLSTAQSQLQAQQVDKATQKLNGKLIDHEATRKAANEFEAMFLGQMMGYMFQDIPTDDYFGGGAGEDMFRSMMVNEYSQKIVARGGMGISDMIYRDMIAMQEKINAQTE